MSCIDSQFIKINSFNLQRLNFDCILTFRPRWINHNRSFSSFFLRGETSVLILHLLLILWQNLRDLSTVLYIEMSQIKNLKYPCDDVINAIIKRSEVWKALVARSMNRLPLDVPCYWRISKPTLAMLDGWIENKSRLIRLVFVPDPCNKGFVLLVLPFVQSFLRLLHL